MEWSNPMLVDMRNGGIDSSQNCTDGGGPEKGCIFGGALHGETCWGGSEIAWEICVEGSSE